MSEQVRKERNTPDNRDQRAKSSTQNAIDFIEDMSLGIQNYVPQYEMGISECEAIDCLGEMVETSDYLNYLGRDLRGLD
jgi:hypothetical protein